ILDQILPGDGLVYLAKVALKKTRLENFKVVSGKKQKFFLYPGKSLYFHAAFNEKTPFFGLLVDFRGFVSLKIQLILLNDKCLCHLWKCLKKPQLCVDYPALSTTGACSALATFQAVWKISLVRFSSKSYSILWASSVI